MCDVSSSPENQRPSRATATEGDVSRDELSSVSQGVPRCPKVPRVHSEQDVPREGFHFSQGLLRRDNNTRTTRGVSVLL